MNTQVTKTQKQKVRDFMAARQQQRTPLPSIEEIRRNLGWGLKKAAR